MHQVLVEIDEMIVNLANFCNFWPFEQFCRSILAIFWGAQCIPNSKIWFKPSKTILIWNISPKTTNLTNYFCLSGYFTHKNRFLTFLGPQNGPPEAQGSKKFWIWCLTPKLTLWPWYWPNKRSCLRILFIFAHFFPFYGDFGIFWPFLAPPL